MERENWFTRLILGKDEWGASVVLDEAQMRRAMYILGLSGMGKSVLMAHLAIQCHRLGEGVLVIDTKDGLLAQEIAARYTDAKEADIIYVAPGLCYWDGQPHYWGLNIFEYKHPDPERKDLTHASIASGAISLFERMGSLEAIMTQVEEHLKLGVWLTVCKPGSTLIDLDKAMTEPAWRRQIMETCKVDAKLKDDWAKFDEAYNSPLNRARELKTTMPRVHRLTSEPNIKNMVSQYTTTLKIGEWLDAGKMVLVNTGENIDHPANIDLGNIIMALAVSEGFRRRNVEREDKRHWRFVIDEFHRLASRQFADLIDQARSRRVWPIMAHQNKEQLKDFRASNNQLFTSVTGAGVEITLKIGGEDQKYYRSILGSERADAIAGLKQYEAEVDVKGGPADSGFPTKVLLEDWWAERDEARLQRLIDAQRQFTQPKRWVDEQYNKRYGRGPRDGTKNGNATTDTKKDPPKPPGTQSQGGDTPAGADRARDRDAAAARQGPFRHKRPGRDDV